MWKKKRKAATQLPNTSEKLKTIKVGEKESNKFPTQWKSRV
jgi:hypothetical protein